MMHFKNCWEALNCPPGVYTRCDVYKTKQGHTCWTVESEFCKHGKSLEGCKSCQWYIHQHKMSTYKKFVLGPVKISFYKLGKKYSFRFEVANGWDK